MVSTTRKFAGGSGGSVQCKMLFRRLLNFGQYYTLSNSLILRSDHSLKINLTDLDELIILIKSMNTVIN